MPKRYNELTAQVVGFAKGIQGHATDIQKDAQEFDVDHTSESDWDGVIYCIEAIEDKCANAKRAAIEERNRCKQLALKLAETMAEHERSAKD